MLRLLRVDGGRTAVLLDPQATQVLDVDASRDAFAAVDADGAAVLGRLLPEATGSWRPMIERWDEAEPVLQRLAATAAASSNGGFVRKPLEDTAVEPPLPAGLGGKVLAIGANFACHLAAVQSVLRGEPVSEDDARGLFPAPWGFVVVTDSIVGPGATVTPPGGTAHLDYEAEVGAVLATGGRDLSPGEVTFWGIVPFNDFSLRDPHLGKGQPFDRGPLTWTLQKNFESGKAMGPWVQVLDEVGEAPNVEILCRVNGDLRQQEWSNKMIWSFPDVVAHLSRYVRLNPGDVIVSGTPKGTALESGADGSAWLRAGDAVETEVGGIGVLRNTIGFWAAD